jgi:hypothetical protein
MKILLLTIMLLLPTQLIAGSGADAESNEECRYVKIKVGDNVFKLLRTSGISLNRDEKSWRPSKDCQNLAEQPIVVDSVYFMAHAIPEELFDEKLNNSFQTIIRDPKKNGKNYIKIEPSVRFKQRLEKEGRKLSDLRVEGDFYVYENANYIAKDDDFVTPMGNPAVFRVMSSPSTFLKLNENLNVTMRTILNIENPKHGGLKKFYNIAIRAIQRLEMIQEK